MKYAWVLLLFSGAVSAQECPVRARTLQGFDDVPTVAIVSFNKAGLQTRAVITHSSGIHISKSAVEQFPDQLSVIYTDIAATQGKYQAPMVFKDKSYKTSYDDGVIIENKDDIAELKKLLVIPKSYGEVCNNTIIVLPLEAPKTSEPPPTPAPVPEPKKKNRLKTPYNRKVSGLASL